MTTRDMLLLPWTKLNKPLIDFPKLGRTHLNGNGKFRVLLAKGRLPFLWQYWCKVSMTDWALRDLDNHAWGEFYALTEASAMAKCDKRLVKMGYEPLSPERFAKLEMLL